MYSGEMPSTRIRFRIMLYPRWNALFSRSASPLTMFLAAAGSSFSSNIMITIPRSSSPRRPARPLIWMNSPELRFRNSFPSHLRTAVNTTVLAGMLSPMLNVSVAKSTLSRPSWNRISITSLRIGSSPPWWIPIPRRSSGRMCSICGRARSSSLSASIALLNTVDTMSFSSSVLNSSLLICSASASHCRLLKANTITGL